MSINPWPRYTDAVRVLFDIERGAVKITPVGETANEVYAGNVTYKCDNGWTVVVFNDCCSFDYVDSMIAPNGEKFDSEDYPFFFQYDPDEPVIRDIYGIFWGGAGQ